MKHKNFIIAVLSSFFIVSGCQISMASQKGTREEAIKMVRNVIKMFRQEGAEKTFRAVNDKKTFRKKDLYAFIMNMKGVMAAHGAVDALVGKNIIELQDGAGKYLVKEFVSVMEVNKTGWVDYKWPSFSSGKFKLDSKSTYLERVNSDYFVAVGVYKNTSTSE